MDKHFPSTTIFNDVFQDRKSSTKIFNDVFQDRKSSTQPILQT